MTKILPQTSFGTRTAEYVRNHWHVVVSPDITLEDVMRPNFWAHHVGSLGPMDLVDVVSQDFGLDVTLRVVGKGIGFVEMRPLRVYVREGAADTGEEAGIDLTVPDGYSVNHVPAHGWRVMTKEPASIISKHHKSRLEATMAAIDHSRRASGSGLAA